jgi:hypothetical protein
MTTLTKTPRKALTALVALGALSLQVSQAAAVSPLVKMACLSDYLSYCSEHAVGSQALRQCMSANGPNLSTSCVKALVAAGEVSATEVARRKQAALR